MSFYYHTFVILICGYTNKFVNIVRHWLELNISFLRKCYLEFKTLVDIF